MKDYMEEHDYLPDVAGVTKGTVKSPEGHVLYAGDRTLRWALLNMPRGVIRVLDSGHHVGRLDTPIPGHTISGGGLSGAGEDDAIFFQAPPSSPVLFQEITMTPGRRSAVSTHDTGDADLAYRIDFDGVAVDGGYDHALNTGARSKWGLNLHRWAGYSQDTYIHDISDEHGRYLHTMGGDCWITQDATVRCGRSAVQHVGREHESGRSAHRLTIADSRQIDCGLNDGGAHLTLQGMAEVVVRRNRSTIGRDAGFVARYLSAHPSKKFGGTHLVNWSEVTDHTPNENLPNDGVWLDEYEAWSAPACGNGTAVQVKNTWRLMLSGKVSITTGSEYDAAIEIASMASVQLVDPVEIALLRGGQA